MLHSAVLALVLLHAAPPTTFEQEPTLKEPLFKVASVFGKSQADATSYLTKQFGSKPEWYESEDDDGKPFFPCHIGPQKPFPITWKTLQVAANSAKTVTLISLMVYGNPSWKSVLTMVGLDPKGVKASPEKLPDWRTSRGESGLRLSGIKGVDKDVAVTYISDPKGAALGEVISVLTVVKK